MRQTRYLYERVADTIEAGIRSGRLRPGGRLPNRYDLAAEHGVSTKTIARALVELHARGLVDVLQTGAWVRGDPDPVEPAGEEIEHPEE